MAGSLSALIKSKSSTFGFDKNSGAKNIVKPTTAPAWPNPIRIRPWRAATIIIDLIFINIYEAECRL
jgi:hypothetical protein